MISKYDGLNNSCGVARINYRRRVQLMPILRAGVTRVAEFEGDRRGAERFRWLGHEKGRAFTWDLNFSSSCIHAGVGKYEEKTFLNIRGS